MVLQLRGELQLEIEADDSGADLIDPLFGRRVTLGASGLATALALEEPIELERALARLDYAGYQRDKVEATLRLFAMLHLIDGIGDDLRAKIRGIWAGSTELEYREIQGARHACQGSGMCCKSYRLGPISEEEADVLRSLPLREAMPDLPDGELIGTIDDHLFLRSRGSQCVFLRDDHRCGIHAHFGEDKKPRACIEYPVVTKANFKHAFVYNNHQCASHFVAQTRGPSLIDAARLTGKTVTGTVTLFHPIVFAHETTPVDYAQYLELEDAMRAAMAAGPPLQQLAHAPALVDSFVEAARALPLGVDPAPHFAAWRAKVALVPVEPPPPPSESDRFLGRELLDALVKPMMELLVGPGRDNEIERDIVPLVSEVLPVLAALQLRVQHLVPGTVAPPLEEPFASALTTTLVQRFTGEMALPGDRPMTGIGQGALAIACAFAGARERTLEALSRGHMLANRVLPVVTRPLFKDHPQLVRALVAVLPSLIAP